MNREIKFRQWDAQHQHMYSPFYGMITPDGNFNSGLDTVLMQYTGLKDKNGVEIYEGDQVTFSVQGDTQINPKTVTIPEFFIDLGHDDPYYRIDEDSFEVIGNIYEKGIN